MMKLEFGTVKFDSHLINIPLRTLKRLGNLTAQIFFSRKGIYPFAIEREVCIYRNLNIDLLIHNKVTNLYGNLAHKNYHTRVSYVKNLYLVSLFI